MEVALPCAVKLTAEARALFVAAGGGNVAARVRVEWNGRMRSAAGRADVGRWLITLNPRLREHGAEEIDRTLRHELAHLLARWRMGRRRIAPHGREWRQACADLGIAGEARCHTLSLPTRRMRRRFIYRCGKCGGEFPRVRKVRRAVACLACCRRFNRGAYDERFRLRLM